MASHNHAESSAVPEVANPAKVHKSAVCVIPPKETWSSIQAIRVVHDKHYKRWMPHMNLLYPFWEDKGDNFRRAAEIIQTALAGTEPFEIQLASFNDFHHGKSCTVWLRPTPSAPFIVLQSKLEAAFSECNDLSQVVADRFCPHLSVGQWRNKKEAQGAISLFQETWTPISFQLTCVSLISRQDV
ncbi:hypothetical protein CLOM_g16677 [Closterium sp. NIES-68]|nr:hypothetical protein CLOM_g16677 [Closterium sp. NIES-68]GJP82795.1 hypothetical protein CLOP_g13026 [Closterium sp. NIES-67]